MQNNLLLSGQGMTLPRAAGAFMPGFAAGGIQKENPKLPHGVSAESIGTSLQPGVTHETLPSPPATPAAKASDFTPPTSVVKSLEAFHITSPQEATRTKTSDSMSVGTEKDSVEDEAPIFPDNQLGLPPSQLPDTAAPETLSPEQRVPPEPAPPLQEPSPEAPKVQERSQGSLGSGAVPGEGASAKGPGERESKKADKNKYSDGTYWKS